MAVGTSRTRDVMAAMCCIVWQQETKGPASSCGCTLCCSCCCGCYLPCLRREHYLLAANMEVMTRVPGEWWAPRAEWGAAAWSLHCSSPQHTAQMHNHPDSEQQQDIQDERFAFYIDSSKDFSDLCCRQKPCISGPCCRQKLCGSLWSTLSLAAIGKDPFLPVVLVTADS